MRTKRDNDQNGPEVHDVEAHPPPPQATMTTTTTTTTFKILKLGTVQQHVRQNNKKMCHHCSHPPDIPLVDHGLIHGAEVGVKNRARIDVG